MVAMIRSSPVVSFVSVARRIRSEAAASRPTRRYIGRGRGRRTIVAAAPTIKKHCKSSGLESV
jgi:hypothetical protein